MKIASLVRRHKVGAIVGALCLVPALASSTVFDFEDISVPGGASGFSYLPAGYQGFTWGGGVGGSSWVISADSGSNFFGTQAHSGNNFAWSNGASDLSLEDGLFDFNSMWARAAHTGFTATAHGFVGASETYTQSFTVSTDYQFFTFGFNGIDKMTITDQFTNILIDDITVNGAPEPATLALLGLGFAGLCFSRWRTLN